MLTTYRELPEAPKGYPLETWDIKLIRPRAATNLVTNPSVEIDATGYTALGGSIARSDSISRRGNYSLAVTPTSGGDDGVLYDTVSLTAGTVYYFSVDFKGIAGVAYRLYFATTGGVVLGSQYRFRGTGNWQRVWVNYQETSTTTRRLYIIKNNHASTGIFYVDGLQVEANRLTTYLDGDQAGFIRGQQAYYWTGTPHVSTSVRSAQTRAGGEEVNLKDFGFTVLALLGLGLSGFQHLSTPNAYMGGSQYDRTVETGRTFDIVGQFDASSAAQLDRQISDLEDILQTGAAVVQQPMVLKFQRQDENSGVALGEPVEVIANFKEGLQGERTNYYQQRTALSFEVYLPFIARLDGEIGYSLDWQDSFTAAYGMYRSNGDWLPLGTGFNGVVEAVVVDPNRGRVYFGGNFTTANGVSANRVAYWDGTTFTALGSGLNGHVYSLALAPNGDLWVGGSFTTAGGSTSHGIARWNVGAGTWTVFALGAGTEIFYALDVAPDGILYAGGTFTNWNGDANSDYAMKYNGSVWSPLGTGMSAAVRSILSVTPTQIFYGGSFVTGNGVTLNGFGYWNGTTFVACSTGVGGGAAVNDIVRTANGDIYLTGGFATAGGITVNRIARWTGSTYEPLGSGLNNYGRSLLYDANTGLLYVAGPFTTAGGLSILSRFAAWNGSAWVQVDVTLPGSPDVWGIKQYLGNLYLGYDDTGSAVSAGLTTVNNPGSANSYPIIKFSGPGVLTQLRNYTSGDVLYFNLTLNAGEKAVLSLEPGNISFVSDWRGDILNTLLPGGAVSFRLVPGDNIISAFITGSTDANTYVLLRFRPAYDQIAKSIYR